MSRFHNLRTNQISAHKKSALQQIALKSVAFTTFFTLSTHSNPNTDYGVHRLLALSSKSKPSVLPTNSTLPKYKLEAIFNDSAIKKLTTNIFAWVDLPNKKVHIFSRPQVGDVWSHDNSLRCNPGVKRYNKTLKMSVSITPPGNYLIQDQGKIRRSRAYGNAPMPYYSRLWDPSQKPSPHQSGIFFHVGKLNDSGSHGCVRLDEDSAKLIQEKLKKGDLVLIRRGY
jgi:lipoprotein-anchoring transpeptidase ErfK/SrfK